MARIRKGKCSGNSHNPRSNRDWHSDYRLVRVSSHRYQHYLQSELNQICHPTWRIHIPNAGKTFVMVEFAYLPLAYTSSRAQQLNYQLTISTPYVVYAAFNRLIMETRPVGVTRTGSYGCSACFIP
jgi:hypothetical protein